MSDLLFSKSTSDDKGYLFPKILVDIQTYLFQIGVFSWIEPKMFHCSSVFSLFNQTVTIVLRLFNISANLVLEEKLIKLKCQHKYFLTEWPRWTGECVRDRREYIVQP